MDTWVQNFLIAYFIIFIGVGVFLRSWLLWKRTGVNAYQLMSKTGVEGVIAVYFKLLPFLSALVLIDLFLGGWAYDLLGPLQWLEHNSNRKLGLILMLVFLLFALVAQLKMGSSWRIGIDFETKTEMVLARY